MHSKDLGLQEHADKVHKSSARVGNGSTELLQSIFQGDVGSLCQK